MRAYQYFFFSFFMLSVLVVSCQDEEVSFIPNGASTFPSDNVVEASFYGRLLDDDLVPVRDAEVWIGDRMVLSDSLGDWVLPDVNVVGRQAYVKVESETCFAASRVLSVSPNSLNRVRIMPIRKQRYQSVQASAGGAVTLPDGSSVTFQPGSFVYEGSGTPYEGDVWVFATSIDGRSERSQVQMPGRLESTTDDAALVSFGMIVADLETPGGEPLQLREDMSATLRYEQDQLNSNAPATIPLWHFDEALGTWVKEGESVLEGNAYVGEVTHFTWWNCDWPEEVVDFCIQFSCGDIVPTLTNRSITNPLYCLQAEFVTGTELSRPTFPVVLDGEMKYCDILPANSSVTFHLNNLDGSRTSVGPFTIGTDEIDLGLHEIDCSLLDPLCGYNLPPRPSNLIGGAPNRPPNGVPPPQVPSPPIPCSLVWSTSTCDNAQEDFWLRVVSNEFNSTPVIIRNPSATAEGVTLLVPSGRRIIVSMLDPSTGDVLGQKQYMPRESIDIGTLNPGSGVIGARPMNVSGRLFNCDGVAGNVYVKLTNTDGDLVAETRSESNGRFSLKTNVCDASLTTLTIAFPEGERTFAAELADDRDFGDIRQCTADGNYYWRVKLNSEIYDYSLCSGRAGSNGWVAYASPLPDNDAPLFGLVHSDKITSTGTFQVGPDERVRFNAFRLAGHSFTASSHPFEGAIRVTEYGQVAAGVFTGSCVDGNGETVTIEIEMRFVKP